jgi:hypothetical protein
MADTTSRALSKSKELSYTKLSTMMECEYCYYLRYVERVKTPTTSPLVFGSAVHNAIKTGYETNNLDREGWEKLFVHEWKVLTSIEDVNFSYDREYFARLKEGKKILGSYYDEFSSVTPAPLYTELRVTRTDSIKVGSLYLVGSIDQIDHENNIIDYKTGTKPIGFTLDFDLQLTFYSYIYRKLFGEPEKSVMIRHLGTMKDMPASPRTERDFSILEEEIAKFEKKIKSTSFLRNVGRSCAYCSYSNICLGRERERFGKF